MKIRPVGSIQRAIHEIGTQCGWDRVASILEVTNENHARRYGDPMYGLAYNLSHSQIIELINLWKEHSRNKELLCPLSIYFAVASMPIGDEQSIYEALNDAVIHIGEAHKELKVATCEKSIGGAEITGCESDLIARPIERIFNAAMTALFQLRR